MKTLHFWDLEETVIDSWQSGLLTNVSIVSDFVAKHKIKEVTIFSFAIWNEKDLIRFDKEFKKMLEDTFEVKIVNVLTTEQIRQTVCQAMCAQFDIHDFLSLWGKKRAFVEFCEAVHPNTHTVLLDDCVPNIVHHNLDTNSIIELVNVTTLFRRDA